MLMIIILHVPFACAIKSGHPKYHYSMQLIYILYRSSETFLIFV